LEHDSSHAPGRIVGPATLLFTDGNATDAASFQSALYQSFREQYQFFNLLNQFTPPVPAIVAPTTPATGTPLWCQQDEAHDWRKQPRSL